MITLLEWLIYIALVVVIWPLDLWRYILAIVLLAAYEVVLHIKNKQ